MDAQNIPQYLTIMNEIHSFPKIYKIELNNFDLNVKALNVISVSVVDCREFAVTYNIK